jgi:uncharacterized protein
VYFGDVVYSSDASQIPELFWLAARWGRRGLATVLDELIAFGALDGDEAPAVARRVLGGNAPGIYCRCGASPALTIRWAWSWSLTRM